MYMISYLVFSIYFCSLMGFSLFRFLIFLSVEIILILSL